MSTATYSDLKLNSLSLLQEYQQTHDARLRNRLVNLNIGLVRKEAHHWSNQCSENYEDLLQVGCLGLIRAIERFDLGKGNAFSSFAIPYIRGEIQHYLRDKSTTVKIPRRWLTLKGQATKFVLEFRQQCNRLPSDSEIAEALGIPLQEWQEIKLAYENREPVSLDVTVGDHEEGATSLADLVPDAQYRSFQLAQEDAIRLQQGLVQLEDRTRSVLEFVFLHDLTQKEVAELLGISVVTVSRQVKKGLTCLKNVMTSEICC
jgi:RNA polymerase sigma-B factor